ncbi:hypothetical protein YT1_1815 [Rhodococcus ruber]|nr:hypothetical protein YT1_1815 [Rhodococcus ruber]
MGLAPHTVNLSATPRHRQRRAHRWPERHAPDSLIRCGWQ